MRPFFFGGRVPLGLTGSFLPGEAAQGLLLSRPVRTGAQPQRQEASASGPVSGGGERTIYLWKISVQARLIV